VFDSDGDGHANWVDPDADGDGVIDGFEGRDDLDGDGVPSYLDPVEEVPAPDAGSPRDPGGPSPSAPRGPSSSGGGASSPDAGSLPGVAPDEGVLQGTGLFCSSSRRASSPSPSRRPRRRSRRAGDGTAPDEAQGFAAHWLALSHANIAAHAAFSSQAASAWSMHAVAASRH